VQQVRQRIVRADRVDEVTLQALRDQDGRHLIPVACAQDAAIATPTVDVVKAALSGATETGPGCSGAGMPGEVLMRMSSRDRRA
jgi:hypothetical protein